MPGTTLFSDIRITLHTRVAARLWQAHPTGMLLCLALLRRLLRAEEADDPWAAHWLKQLRIRLNLIAHLLKQKPSAGPGLRQPAERYPHHAGQ
jgi:hypothetical protein